MIIGRRSFLTGAIASLFAPTPILSGNLRGALLPASWLGYQVSLHHSRPFDDLIGSEAKYGSYLRQTITETNVPPAIIDFPATIDNARRVVTHFAISNNGKIIHAGQVSPNIILNEEGITPRIMGICLD